MRPLFAPDSYGGFLSAPAACCLAQRVLAAVGVALDAHPMADGGEGTQGVLRHHRARAGKGFIESALLLGPGLGEMRGPWRERSSAPLGARLGRAGDDPLLVGLGGTATMDGGAGALQALGLRLRDEGGRALPVPVPAGDLERVARVEGPCPLRGRLLEVLCDVRSPLCRAPAVYGPQKGLSPEDIARQTAAFARWGEALGEWRAREGLGDLPVDASGGGAAGGLGYALASIGARLVPGAACVARWTGLTARLAGRGVVVVGEGRLDASSFDGKVLDVVARAARRAGVGKLIALVGQVRDPTPPPCGPDEWIAIGEPSLEAYIAALEVLAERLGSRVRGP